MKKLIALIAVFAFVLTIAAPMADAATVKKTTKVVKKKVVKKVPAKKVAPRAITPIAPPPVAVPPPPPPAKVAPAASAGLFGWGLKTDINVGYVMDKSILYGRGNIILPDPLGLGPIVGLSADSVGYKLGLGGFSGNDNKDKSFKGIPIYLDGVIRLPADLLGGIKSYLSGGINYLLARSGSASGSIGGQIAFGIAGDIGLGSDTCLELGYSILRTGDSKTPRSSKGLTVSVGQAITL